MFLRISKKKSKRNNQQKINTGKIKSLKNIFIIFSGFVNNNKKKNLKKLSKKKMQITHQNSK